MTFAHAAMVAGLGAIGIPILIHFLNQRRFHVVKWGAMHLLRTSLQSKLRFEQIILLAVRCAIPAALALLMARPILVNSKSPLGAKASVVLVVDCSYSMEAGGPEHSNFQAAREAAQQLLAGLPAGSQAAVVPMATGVSSRPDVTTFDIAQAGEELKRLKAGYGTADVTEALKVAKGILDRMTHSRREVVVFSDFQRATWPGSDAAARSVAAGLLRQEPLPATLSLFHAGSAVKDNTCVEALEFSRPILGVGQPLQVRAQVQNYGDATYPSVRIAFQVDGKPQSVSRAALGPYERAQVVFRHAFDKPGSHLLEVSTDADPLEADNTARASVQVWERLPVLLVSGDRHPEPFKSETDFLEIALKPFGATKAELADLVTTQVLNPDQLSAKLLSSARVVVLANVPSLRDDQVKSLEDFVRGGGGLLIFPGDKVDAAWYEKRLLAGGKGLLPMPLATSAGSAPASNASGVAIASQYYDHPALEMFNDPKNGNLTEARISRWFRLDEDAGRRADGALVLARLTTGDAFLVEKKFGEGSVLQCCGPCDADWSTFPLRPSYLPFMQQVVTYLAARVEPPRNVQVGQPLVAFLPAADAGIEATLVGPEGETYGIPVVRKGSRGVAEFARTFLPGAYTLETPGGESLHFVVNTDRKESDLRQLSESEIRSAADAMGASAVSSSEEYRAMDDRRRRGFELWPLFWSALLFLAGFELFLEQRFARRKRLG
jgi:hypothetical protein